MEAQDAVELAQQAIRTGLLVGSPVLLVGAIVGLLVGLLQALTQIQDQTVSFVPKIVCMVLALRLCLPWIVQSLIDYSQQLLTNIPQMVMTGG